MRAIQKYLPDPRHTEIDRIFVNATPQKAWEAARHFDAATIPWIKILFDIRTLPDALLGTKHTSEGHHIAVDQIAESGTGFMILEELPGSEVVIGSVGQFWHLSIPFAHIATVDFAAFSEPGWGKLAWAIAVEPFLSGSTISLELRTTATDQESWEKLKHYYRLIGLGSRPIRHSVMAHLEATLGKMVLPDDDSRMLPGDALIPAAKYDATHHINIEAPASIVWRYLMQLGCDRAGWYSIDQLDNGGKHSVDHLVPGWEIRKIGERIAATPALDDFFEVYDLRENKYFIIGGETDRLNSRFSMSWTFNLEPVGDDATHVTARARMETTPEWKEWLLGNVLYPPVHGLMSAAQLKNIKRLAERDALARKIMDEPGVH